MELKLSLCFLLLQSKTKKRRQFLILHFILLSYTIYIYTHYSIKLQEYIQHIILYTTDTYLSNNIQYVLYACTEQVLTIFGQNTDKSHIIKKNNNKVTFYSISESSSVSFSDSSPSSISLSSLSFSASK